MKQILIVEDDNLLNKTLAYNLASDDYAITNVLNARAAAEALKAKSFDLVLLDINLPDGNGYDLCRLIKPEHPDTVVIFLTANDQECDQIWGYEVGAVDYITKPFSIGALQRKVKAMFAMLEHHKPAKDIVSNAIGENPMVYQTDFLPRIISRASPYPQSRQDKPINAVINELEWVFPFSFPAVLNQAGWTFEAILHWIMSM